MKKHVFFLKGLDGEESDASDPLVYNVKDSPQQYPWVCRVNHWYWITKHIQLHSKPLPGQVGGGGRGGIGSPGLEMELSQASLMECWGKANLLLGGLVPLRPRSGRLSSSLLRSTWALNKITDVFWLGRLLPPSSICVEQTYHNGEIQSCSFTIRF